MLLTDRAESTLEAVLDIACHARPDPVSAGEVAARLGRPRRHLEGIMQQLAHAGILKGVRGPRGGYMLARERRRIRVGEILRIVAAAESGGVRTRRRSPAAPRLEPLRRICAEMEKDFFRRLDRITIEELCAAHDRTAGPRGGDVDFSI